MELFQKYRLLRACLLAIPVYFSGLPSIAQAQHLSKGFELRYFSNNINANGETDFKGETSTLDTDKRIEFLKFYSEEVSSYYGDKDLIKEVASDEEAFKLFDNIKPQPLPTVRKRVALDEWKWLSYKAGQHESSIREINKYTGAENMLVKDGTLYLHGVAQWKWDFPVQTWRYTMSWRVRALENDAAAEFSLQDNSTGKIFSKIGIAKNVCFYFSAGEKIEFKRFSSNEWIDIKIEADMVFVDGSQHYNLFVNGKLAGNYVKANENISQVNGFEVKAFVGIEIDSLYGVGYQQTTNVSYPYYPETFIDENFDVIPSAEGWQTNTYDDSKWKSAKLPIGQGSERFKGEDLYFRKKIRIENFKRAFINIEALDPGGEIWINGQIVSVINDRYPIKLDITRFLKPFSENIISLKVNHFYLNPGEGKLMPCSYLDFNAGWFAGRAWIDLVGETFVNDAFLYTKSIKEKSADIHAKIEFEHKGTLAFKGKIIVKMTPWEKSESSITQIVALKDILSGPGIKTLELDFSLNDPQLWTPESPFLYVVSVEILDKNGKTIDDYTLTTGVRTISQEGGTFRLNGKPAMLNGTQIMGYRYPIENMMAWLRCPPDYWVAKEMLMVKKMNCNMLRMHVHGWKEKAIGVNDPRYCELADQMGIMLIVCPPAWIREGDWGQIDFDGYHKYMKPLQNHPSIVMWEIANHPNTFKQHDLYETDLFCEESYNAVYPYDPSRLISLTSHIGHLHYGNDAGTLNQWMKKEPDQNKKNQVPVIGNQDALTSYGTKSKLEGAKIKPNKAWTAPMVTRGNQDAPTGYGYEWSRLRNWPGAYRQGFLDSNERAYFNFEHEESIGQPNWDLCKGKPWYNLQSYEWGYDEGSIGRKLLQSEWRESQAWQAFSAYEAIKKLRKLDYDGFSWCCLHGGANSGTYKKPIIDFMGYAKLAFYIHQTVYQPILAGSNNVDIVYGPDDKITPMVLNVGVQIKVKLTVIVKDKLNGKELDKKVYENVILPEGRSVTELASFKPNFKNEGLYFIEYIIDKI